LIFLESPRDHCLGFICLSTRRLYPHLKPTCVGLSLSELASALPNAGGQYFWANELAPQKYAKFASYLTGWFAWAGSIFTSVSVAVSLGSSIVGCIQLFHPGL
jgi:choline transport protein